jgi:predicted nucleotidyltransferase component of viral defense system
MNLGMKIRKLASDNKLNLSANQIRVIVALERAVARLEHEPKLKDHLIFKGGFVLLKTIESARFTRDLDALAYEISQDKAGELAKKALAQNLKDGIHFLDIQLETIPDQGDYGGLRLNCAFQVSDIAPISKEIKKLSRIHIDIAFGDEVPKSGLKSVEMPTVLDEKQVSWQVYPLEFIFAEKLQTLIERGSANSRAKDVYDLVEIYPECTPAKKLTKAIKEVFEHRKTAIPNDVAKVVSTFDHSILRNSWGSVDIGPSKPDFDEYWEQLLELLKDIT